MRRIELEAATGYCMFSSNDTEGWNMQLETLGRLCAEAWHHDLPEADRAWAEAHREKFGRWVHDSRPESIHPRANAGSLQSRQGRVDKEPAPPWPMLLEAVKSAFLALVVDFGQAPPGESGDATADPAARLDRTSLWRTLTADDTAQVDRPTALRAFQRGFRRGRRGNSSSMTRPIPPMLEPPQFWGLLLPGLTGPSAERERALEALPFPRDRKEYEARKQELRDLHARAWGEDLPEEDREWAESYRHACMDSVNRRRRDAVAQSAYEGYLQSSDGLFNGEPARPWPNLTGYASKPWRCFVNRVEDAPEGESELATAEAAVREYWDSLYREAPPWDSDPAQRHWLAAVRAAQRKALADDAPPSMES
jgi:hypothetical protein